MPESDEPWRDVDQYLTYDPKAARWHYKVPMPFDLKPLTGSCDFKGEARRIVADYVRDKGPARVVRARTSFRRE
jgi:hypothetical protein